MDQGGKKPVWTVIDNGKLANQIARLPADVVKTLLPEPDFVAIAKNTTNATKTTQIMSRQTPNHLMVAIIKNQV